MDKKVDKDDKAIWLHKSLEQQVKKIKNMITIIITQALDADNQWKSTENQYLYNNSKEGSTKNR